MRYWPVPSVTDDLDFLDQRRARRFDGDAGQHRAGRILHDARNRRLGVRGGRQQQNDSRKNPRSRESQH